jgi:hydroxymethylbilane synthase
MTRSTVTIATRGSALALWQANTVRDALRRARPDWSVELLVIKTTGDRITDRPLARIGGKALFVKEIEQALLDGRADVAVHSMKDVPAELADGLHMAAVSERADPFDALCTRDGRGLDELPEGAHVGTASMRRMCQLLARRPDLRVSSLRGNVPTRLGKLDAGDFDAIVLAAAGLTRLGHADRISQRLEPPLCIPAVGQGALGIETRADDEEVSAVAREALHHARDAARVAAERAMLARLEGSCQTPMAAYARYATDGSDELFVEGLVGSLDGARILRAERRGPAADAARLGEELADELIAGGALAIIEACVQAGDLAP